MEGIEYPIRFITDEHFIQELLKDKKTATQTILKLNHIHKNSKYLPMEHNLMSDEALKNSIKDKAVRGPALIGAFHPEPWPSFLNGEENQESKLMRYAISSAAKSRPWRIIILTSEEKAKNYKQNSHYQKESVKSAIKISSGEEALKIIDIVSRI